MKSKVFGYARVSSKDQNEERQLVAFKEYGIDERDIYVDKQSGKDFNREQYSTLKHILRENDLLVIGVSNILKTLNFGLGAIRSQLAKKYNLIKPNTYDILWVVDFPLFEKSEETGEITPCHHPFTRPLDKDLDKLESEPYKVYSYTYDIVMNGYEAGGGGLRIYDQDVQKRIFNVLGFSDEDIKRKFGWFIDALKFGTPPHGGLAFGLDRLTMILSGTDNIRDVIAFPKNLSAVCPMTNAPQPVDNDQLKDLGIKVIDKEEK